MKVENKTKLVAGVGEQAIIDSCDTSKTSGKFRASDLPDTIIIHYTGGTTASGAINTLTNPQIKASAHFVVDDDSLNKNRMAEITQLIPLTHVGWHAGVSSYGNRHGINKYSIGIEIVNPGWLVASEDSQGNTMFRTAYGSPIKDISRVQKMKHKNETSERYWYSYTEEQIKTVEKMCFAIRDVFPIKHILGHDEISPTRKVDPGPCYPIDILRSHVLDLRSMDDDDEVRSGVVIASKLNIRASNDVNAKKVAMPLREGTKVTIVDNKGGWYKVKAEIEGWVSSDYVSL